MKKKNKISIVFLVFSILLLVGVMAIVNSGNPLDGAKVNEYVNYSGSGEKIGTYAVVKLSNKDFDKLTPEYFAEYAISTVDNSGYDYYTIASKDGRGAIWEGSSIYCLRIGTLNKDYTIEKENYILTLNNGKYIKTE